ncbi:MAG: DUF4435 domain-containing protein [Dysgonamonadaceae bacterium]|jgi:hypothetical protein|nr:DUF4435 domain-containing protein [Dysgonamonadaceae bacterium]
MEENRTLKGSLDATNKINDIRLSLRNNTGSKIIWILVEGTNDCKIYPKFFEKDKAKVEFVYGGKGQLNIALTTLANETEQVAGIRDADFLHLEKTYPNTKNLFFTDYHDIEMTMLGFEEVRNNLASEYRLSDNLQKIWDNVLNESAFIAYIRWYNEQKRCKIRFDGIKFGGNLSEITEGKISIKKQELLIELNNRSANKAEKLTFENIDHFINQYKTSDFLNLCNGHDTTALFSLLVEKQVSHTEFCRHLRLSFTGREFSTTKLYSAIYDWQQKNGFDILKQLT